jgi:hypothetical protein
VSAARLRNGVINPRLHPLTFADDVGHRAILRPGSLPAEFPKHAFGLVICRLRDVAGSSYGHKENGDKKTAADEGGHRRAPLLGALKAGMRRAGHPLH